MIGPGMVDAILPNINLKFFQYINCLTLTLNETKFLPFNAN